MWTLSEFKYDWPTSDMKIYRDFTFVDYKNDIKNLVDEKNVEISGCVYVQVLNNYEETGIYRIHQSNKFNLFMVIILNMNRKAD